MVIVPDLAGFREAQGRKRTLLGEDVTFYSDPSVTWPPGTPLNTAGEPLDPTVTAVSSAVASARIVCGVAFRTIRLDSDSESGALGRVDHTHVMVIASSGAASAIEPMRSFDARGEHFIITAQKFDGVSAIDRYLVYGQRT